MTTLKQPASSRLLPLVALGLLACLAVAAPAQAGPNKPMLTVHLPTGGVLGGGVGVRNDSHGTSLDLCWYYTSDEPDSRVGYTPSGNGWLVYFPFVDTQPIIDYVHGGNTGSPPAPDGAVPALQQAVDGSQAPGTTSYDPNAQPSTGTQYAGESDACHGGSLL